MPAFAAETGYGQWLRQHADDNGIESANFTVLDQSESVIQPCPETRRLKLVVRQLHWDALLAIPHDGQSNPLISDLYETLSSLGVRAMQYEQTNNERVTASLELAGKAGNVLRDVKSQLGCADKYSYIEGSAEASGWWFGMYLLRLQGQTKHAKAFQRQLAKVCAQDGYYLVWYGYMSDPLGKGSQCSVWAWIGNEKKRDHLISKWDETIGICRPDKEGDAAVLTAYRKPDDKTADRDWFVRTLRYISSLK